LITKYRYLSIFLVALAASSIILFTYSGGETQHKQTAQSMTKWEINKTMQSYLIGRFLIDVPSDMQLSSQNGTIRSSETYEFIWPQVQDKSKIREEMLKTKLAEIKKFRPPKGKESAFIEIREIKDIPHWTRGILYYSNYLGDEVKWVMLTDFGRVGVWTEMRSGKNNPANIGKMIQSFSTFANAYQVRCSNNASSLPSGNWFHLRYGSVNLPYKIRERSRVCFYDPSNALRLEIEMNETYKVEDIGLSDRLSAAINSNYAPGVEVDKIRAHKRTAAGLKGEEVVFRTTDSKKTVLNFGWEFPGEKDSGEKPEIQITMDSPDGNLDEKLKIWDAILDSFKPMYKTGK